MLLFNNYATETCRRHTYINQNRKIGESRCIIYPKQLDTSIRILNRATILYVARDATYVTSLSHQLSVDVCDK
jgi:hypothetical protein